MLSKSSFQPTPNSKPESRLPRGHICVHMPRNISLPHCLLIKCRIFHFLIVGDRRQGQFSSPFSAGERYKHSERSIIWPKIGYNFQNGLLLELSFAFIDGNPDEEEEVDPVFYTFRNNDILMWKVRYEF